MSSSATSQPAAIYVWLVPSEYMLDQPGSWRIRKWDIEPFPEANYTLRSETVTFRDALLAIKALKAENIGDTGFATGPLALFNAAQRIAKNALKNAAAQDAPYRKAGDRIAEVDETRQGVEKGRPLSDERKPGPAQLSGDSTSDAVTAAVCDERKTSPGTTPAAAASIRYRDGIKQGHRAELDYLQARVGRVEGEDACELVLQVRDEDVPIL